MEDAHCAELDLNGTEACFFGVYDGHGGNKTKQVQRCIICIFKQVEQQPILSPSLFIILPIP